jgi:hypothetical protein
VAGLGRLLDSTFAAVLSGEHRGFAARAALGFASQAMNHRDDDEADQESEH